IVTTGNEVLAGKILYNPAYDLVVLRQGDSRVVINPQTMKSFRYYDEGANINRKFITAQGNGFGEIYEVVVAGQIMVLRRGKAECGPSPSDADGYNYFFVRDGAIQALRKFRNRLYPEIKNALAGEMKKQHLNPNHDADVIRLIEIYNSRQFTASLARK
ncbi:MAG TPA: hypothetical protein VG737_01445, partial [Cyclobacteriaceae bacterium]|nr:hypothetical protein [Cyclobacteriaceae bacterium]